VIESCFETFNAPTTDPFDLVSTATAWHWLDPTSRYRRAWELLGPGEHLASGAQHVFTPGGDPFFAELQEVYEQIGEGLPEDAAYPRPGELPDEREDIEGSGLFGDVVVLHFDWEVIYDAKEHLRPLDTFFWAYRDTAMAAGWSESQIWHRLARQPDGRLRRGWSAVLPAARRLDARTAP
jgi:hypothetical protein